MNEDLEILNILEQIDEAPLFKDKEVSYKTKNKTKIPIKKIKEFEVIESFYEFYKSNINSEEVRDEKEMFYNIFSLFKDYIGAIKELSLSDKMDYHVNLFNGTFIFKYIHPEVYAGMNYKSKTEDPKEKISIKFKEKKYQTKKA